MICEVLTPLINEFSRIFPLLTAIQPNAPDFEQQNEIQKQYAECLCEAMSLARLENAHLICICRKMLTNS